MPTYTYRCDECGHATEQIHAARKRLALMCEKCNRAPMTWVFPVPSIQTDATFLANRDDGFGKDNRSRKIAHARARAAGVNPTGKVYCAGLCPPGEPFSPSAWITDKADVKARCRQNGWGSEDMGIKPILMNEEPKPYRVADDLVEGEVDRIIRDSGGDVTPAEREKLTHETRERVTPAAGSI